MGVDHGWCPIAVQGAVLRPKGQGSEAKANDDIVELQPWDAKNNRVVAELHDEHRQCFLVFEYCEVGVGNMCNRAVWPRCFSVAGTSCRHKLQAQVARLLAWGPGSWLT